MIRIALGLCLVALLAMQAAPAAAKHWCDGAYDEKLGTNFGACPGPGH